MTSTFSTIRNRALGKFEIPLLIAISQLGEEAYGAIIVQKLSQMLDRAVTLGQVSRSVNTMRRYGILEAKSVYPDNPKKGQRSRLVFTITKKGHELLKSVQTQEAASVAKQIGQAEKGHETPAFVT